MHFINMQKMQQELDGTVTNNKIFKGCRFLYRLIAAKQKVNRTEQSLHMICLCRKPCKKIMTLLEDGHW